VVSRSAGEHRADIIDKVSVETALDNIGQVAIIAARPAAVFKPSTRCRHFATLGGAHLNLSSVLLRSSIAATPDIAAAAVASSR
jgi:hypothetical protein